MGYIEKYGVKYSDLLLLEELNIVNAETGVCVYSFAPYEIVEIVFGQYKFKISNLRNTENYFNDIHVTKLGMQLYRLINKSLEREHINSMIQEISELKDFAIEEIDV